VKCVLCGGEAGRYGHNAFPLSTGRCCEDCNAVKVIPARLASLENRYHEPYYETMKKLTQEKAFSEAIKKREMKI